MRRLGWFASLVLVVGLVGTPKAQAQGTVEELLRAAPADAVATIVVRSFTDFQQDLAMVANTVVPGEGMTLPMLLQQALGTPGGQGLNLGNSLGVVVLPLEEGGASGGVLLPMASYQDFAASLEAVGFTKGVADGLDSYSAGLCRAGDVLRSGRGFLPLLDAGQVRSPCLPEEVRGPGPDLGDRACRRDQGPHRRG